MTQAAAVTKGEEPPAKEASGLLSQTTVTFLSTLFVQAATFVVLSISALKMPTSAFADLSIITASAMMSAALLELGISITATKWYRETLDEDVLASALIVRIAIVPIALAISTTIGSFFGMKEIALGIALGAVLNIWNGGRSADQARQDYRSFSRKSLIFATIRLTAGLATLFLVGNPMLVAVAIYALPTLAGLTLARRLPNWSWASISRSWDAARYALFVYIASVTFIALQYVPQFVSHARMDEGSVATYGIALTFASPVSLLVYSLRSVLLPRMIGKHTGIESFLWSRRGRFVVFATLLTMLAAGYLGSLILEFLYGGKYPDIAIIFVVFFAGYSATATIGIYSLSLHTVGVPRLGALVGLIRLTVLTITLLFTRSLLDVVVATAVVMVASEVMLVALLARVRPR